MDALLSIFMVYVYVYMVVRSSHKRPSNRRFDNIGFRGCFATLTSQAKSLL